MAEPTALEAKRTANPKRIEATRLERRPPPSTAQRVVYATAEHDELMTAIGDRPTLTLGVASLQLKGWGVQSPAAGFGEGVGHTLVFNVKDPMKVRTGCAPRSAFTVQIVDADNGIGGQRPPNGMPVDGLASARAVKKYGAGLIVGVDQQAGGSANQGPGFRTPEAGEGLAMGQVAQGSVIMAGSVAGHVGKGSSDHYLSSSCRGRSHRELGVEHAAEVVIDRNAGDDPKGSTANTNPKEASVSPRGQRAGSNDGERRGCPTPQRKMVDELAIAPG